MFEYCTRFSPHFFDVFLVVMLLLMTELVPGARLAARLPATRNPPNPQENEDTIKKVPSNCTTYLCHFYTVNLIIGQSHYTVF